MFSVWAGLLRLQSRCVGLKVRGSFKKENDDESVDLGIFRVAFFQTNLSECWDAVRTIRKVPLNTFASLTRSRWVSSLGGWEWAGKDAGHGFQLVSEGDAGQSWGGWCWKPLETPEVSNEASRISSSHEPFESVLKGWRRWRGPATEQRNCSARPTEEAVGQMMWRNESIVPCLSCLGTLAMPMTSDDVALVKCQPCIPVPRLVHWTGWLKDVKAKLYCPVYIYREVFLKIWVPPKPFVSRFPTKRIQRWWSPIQRTPQDYDHNKQ